MRDLPLFQLSKEQAGFIESGVSIIVASRDAQNRPLLGHGLGCYSSPGQGRITLFLSRRKHPLLLDAIRRSGTIAVTFSEPSSTRSMQIKGNAAEIIELDSGDADSIAAYIELFAADLDRIGHRGILARTILACAPGDYAAVSFVPNIAFTQTPGPAAGNRIGA